MFQSYEYQKYLGYDDATKEYRWQYKITDSDFEEVVVVVGVGVVVGRGRGRGHRSIRKAKPKCCS